jgi:hypothetical protein
MSGQRRVQGADGNPVGIHPDSTGWTETYPKAVSEGISEWVQKSQTGLNENYPIIGREAAAKWMHQMKAQIEPGSTTLYSEKGRLEVDPKTFDWPIDTSKAEVSLNVSVEMLAEAPCDHEHKEGEEHHHGTTTIRYAISDDGKLVFETVPPGGSFAVTFPYSHPEERHMQHQINELRRINKVRPAIDRSKVKAKKKQAAASRKRNRK